MRPLCSKEDLLLDLDQDLQNELPSLTAEIVASYVANNTVHVSDLPNVISSVHAALTNLGQSKSPEPEKLTPPVSIRKSIGDDFLISMEDGRRYKSLKRHLAGRGLTPQQYRHKWGLPSDYPMVAPAYARQRSELAKALGLGRKREEAPAPAPAPKRSGRKKAAAPAEAA
jgi:predicted transcriptional regulator